MADIKGWQPIETAPKDGTEIIARDDDGAVYGAAWDAESEAWRAICGQPVVYAPEPSKWMPLPEPPEAE